MRVWVEIISLFIGIPQDRDTIGSVVCIQECSSNFMFSSMSSSGCIFEILCQSKIGCPTGHFGPRLSPFSLDRPRRFR